MKIIPTQQLLSDTLDKLREQPLTTGFVPTMGALHAGHLRLLEQARAENDIVVCSIFVNPVQFNNASDLERYPRHLDNDIALIENICDILFVPSVKEMYPVPPSEKYDFGTLETVMEGQFRPGHFNGVAIVVKRLFDMVKPDTAYFGKKDFQQLTIIRKLVEDYGYDIKIQAVDIVREDDGLAMSSRNRLLSPQAREIAPFIRQTLLEAKSLAEKKNPQELSLWIADKFNNHEVFTLEYIQLVDAHTLEEIKNYTQTENIVACIAVWLDNVRLIDNIMIK